MSKKTTDPFDLIASKFPFQMRLPLCDEDRAKLVNGLLNYVANQIENKQSDTEISLLAARHVVYLDEDYGLGYAAAYFEYIRKVPRVKLNDSFFKYSTNTGSIQDIIKRIYAKSESSEDSDSSDSSDQTDA